MKKLLLLAVLAVTMTFNVQAQVYKTINVTTAGSLGSLLTSTEKTTVTNLTLTGSIDARDFAIMGTQMHNLTTLDISSVTIQAYNGSTVSYYNNISYLANEIPEYCVSGSSLKTVTLPQSLTSIGESAFSSVKGLTSITIPNSVIQIGMGAFYYCTGLTSVNIPNGVIGVKAFSGCSGLSSINFGGGVTSIGDMAFNACSDLTSLTIPSSITSIGSSAFGNCNDLTDININSGTIGYAAFGSLAKLKSVTLGSGVTSIGYGAFSYCPNLTNLNLASGIVTIGQNAFLACPALTNFSIPNSVTSLGDEAFAGCSGLTSLTTPNSVTSIGNSAFSHCSGLTTITLGSGVTSIGNGAFSSCTALKTINCLNTTPPTLGTNLLLMSDYTQNPVTDVYVPNVTALAAYRANTDWIGYFPGNIIKTNNSTPVTYSVTVPTGTNACYIAGTMNGWIQQAMTKVDATHFNLNIPTATINDTYKYCSGPIWAYEELDANNNVISNRSYSSNDVVAKWKSVYSDVKTVNSDNIKLMSGKSFIRAEFNGNAIVEVYSLSGIVVKQANATNTISIDNLNAGLYIVKINGSAYKVVVK